MTAVTTPLPAEAPAADRTPFTIDDADAFTAKVLELHKRIEHAKAAAAESYAEARRLDELADKQRREWREAEREMVNLVGVDW